MILKDPAVESLSSFIGIDGTNTTLNSGRVLINLKPLGVRKVSASDVIRRLQPELAQVPGITLFMQPVQDLTVEDRVSRTQFQYTLEDPNVDELNTFAPRMLAALQKLPELRDVPFTHPLRLRGTWRHGVIYFPQRRIWVPTTRSDVTARKPLAMRVPQKRPGTRAHVALR